MTLDSVIEFRRNHIVYINDQSGEIPTVRSEDLREHAFYICGDNILHFRPFHLLLTRTKPTSQQIMLIS